MSETPARFARRNYGNGHGYTLDGAKIPGVTTVINTLAKPALVDWAARMAGRFALDHWAELSSMAPTERLDAITSAHRNVNRTARTNGTRLHTFGYKLAIGEPVEVPPELTERVEAYARFLDTWELQPVFTELPVVNYAHRYGGTLDAIMTAPRLGTVLLDIKTGGVFNEVALQLAAYWHTDAGLVDGETVTLGADAIDGAYVARVHTDTVELVPVVADESVWQAFLHLLTVYRWVQSIKEESPIGSALYPEEVPA